MKIEGMLTMEGVNLHVHIDVPDNLRDVFVTNIPPDALIVTRDRVRIESLGFTPEFVESLRLKGIYYLNHLVNERWHLTLDRLNEQERRTVVPIVRMFLEAALVPFDSFDGEIITADEAERMQERMEQLRRQLRAHDADNMPAQADDAKTPDATALLPETIAHNGHSYDDISVLELSAGITKELREVHHIQTVPDLCRQLAASRDQLLSGRYISEKTLARIEEKLRARGAML